MTIMSDIVGNNLIFRKLIIRNFLSFGNEETEIRLDDNLISALIGINRDVGEEESKNGAGKSSIMDAFSYVNFGKTFRDINKGTIVHFWCRKNESSYVIEEFEKKGMLYRIERGEQPSKLRFFAKPVDCADDFYTKDGSKFLYELTCVKKAETDKLIQEVLGFDFILFSFLIANSSETISFFEAKEEDRRKSIESLFDYSILSKKADILKKQRVSKNKARDQKKGEIDATEQANARIRLELDQIDGKIEQWETNHKATIHKLKTQIEELNGVDYDLEDEVLATKEILDENFTTLRTTLREHQQAIKLKDNNINNNNNHIKNKQKRIEKIDAELKVIAENTCPTCEQHWDNQEGYKEKIEQEKALIEEEIKELETKNKQYEDEKKTYSKEMESLTEQINELQETYTELDEVELYFDNRIELNNAKNNLNKMKERLEELEKETNPYIESKERLNKNTLAKVDYEGYEALVKEVKHYNLLIELLTSKESFIRKNLLKNSLSQLNKRMSYHLKALGLPHRVVITPSLSVDITHYKKAYSFGNLSKGERNRLKKALNFAYQDVYQMTMHHINLLFIDELLDDGTDQKGAADAVKILREKTQNMNKKVFLITHREDIASLADETVYVVKENETTRLER